MNQRQYNFNQGALRILYRRYKQFVMPLLAIIICVVIVYFEIIPQIQDVFSLQNDIQSQIQSNQQLVQNAHILTGISDQTINNQLKVANEALPPDKDFVGIINAVNTSASLANVSLGDYSFSVGDLSTASSQLKDQVSLQMSLSINGNVDKIENFIKELNTKLPLVEVTDINYSNQVTQIKTSFFYKPFLQESIDINSPIHALSAADSKQINQLSSWRVVSQHVSVQSATGSAKTGQ